MMFTIEFVHKETKKAELLHPAQYTFDTLASAWEAAEHLNSVDNPAWYGTYAAVPKPEGTRS